MKYKGPLFFSQSRVKGFGEFMHFLIENTVLFRWNFFKNRPRNTYLLVRSFLVTSVIFGIYFSLYSNLDFVFMGIEVEPILLFVAFTTVGYWNMYANFQRKAAYTSNLYNDVIKEYASGNKGAADLMAVNFSTQLMNMDFWAHRMYSELFSKCIENSLDYAFSDRCEKNPLGSVTREEFDTKLNKGTVRVYEMRQVFYVYEDYLLEQCISDKSEVTKLKAVS